MTKIVGILNVTPDSFSDGGKFNSLESALFRAQEMIRDGVDVIDIGAESTRPKATPIGPVEEWARLEKILPAVVDIAKKHRIKVSIDSYHFETLIKAYEVGVDVINDVSGLSDERIVDFIAAKNIETVLMHNVTVPPIEGSVVNKNINLVTKMVSWGQKKISNLEKKNVKKSQLIFDVGIGFGKDASQSIYVLKMIDEFRVLGTPLYVGHSKKSFLEAVKIDGSRAEKTLVISRYLAEKGVDFIRVHDVKENLLAIAL